MATDPHLEAEELSAGTQAAWDWFESMVAAEPNPILRTFANKYLTMDKLTPLVSVIVSSVDSVRDKEANPSQEHSTT